MRWQAIGMILTLTFSGPVQGQDAADDDPCMRHDYSRMQQMLRSVSMAAEAGQREVGKDVARRMGPCMTFSVTITSTLTTLGATGVQLSATGTASFLVSLGPGSIQDAEYDFASAPEGVDATMVWSNVMATGGPCTTKVAVGSPSSWNFWLGITVAPDAKAGLVAGPNETDLHDFLVKCEKGSNRQKTPVFAPAWTVAHGDGEDGESGAARSSAEVTQRLGDMGSMMAKAEDAKRMQEQLEKGQVSNEELQRKMQSMFGGSTDAADKASDNFMITMDGDATPGRAEFAKHTISRVVPLKGGQGTVREHTVIEIVHVPSSKP